MSRQPAAAKYTPEVIWPIFSKYVNQDIIQNYLKQVNRRFYQRIYTPLLIVWGFLYQRLQADHSCDAFVSCLTSDVNRTVALCESTSAYCQARKRLPLELAKHLLLQSAKEIEDQWSVEGEWFGRQVYLVDGSTLRLPASQELVNYYGCPSGGRGSSHWPVMRVMTAFHWWSGCIREVVEAPHEQSEYAMAVTLMRKLPSEAILVMDQMFGIYRIVQVAHDCNLDVVIRMPAKNVQKWVRAYNLSANREAAVSWSPSIADHPEVGVSIVAVAGRLLQLELVRDGFRPKTIYLFTTLTDPKRDPMSALASLYTGRWRVELDLRHVKTTLQMEALTGKSLDIVRKELWLGLLAYNLIRVLILTAALRAGLSPTQLSLAACWRRIQATAQSFTLHATPPVPFCDSPAFDRLLDRLAQCRLPTRKHDRHEPRAVWGKPQPFPYLKGSRQAARSAALAPLLIS